VDQETTILLLAAGLLAALLATLGDRARQRRPLAWHAYMPWNAVIFAGLAAALFAAVHLVTMMKGGMR
jgi:hypothetical protein